MPEHNERNDFEETENGRKREIGKKIAAHFLTRFI